MMKPMGTETRNTMLSAGVNIGTINLNPLMSEYVYIRRTDGVHMMNLNHTWSKLQTAVRFIHSVLQPAQVCAISTKANGRRPVMKFAAHTGADFIVGDFVQGTFTNDSGPQTHHPLLLIVTDPASDHMVIAEAASLKIPIIAFCDTDTPTHALNLIIPCNNKTVQSIGTMWWLFARELALLRGHITWSFITDRFCYFSEAEAEADYQADKAQALSAVNK